MTSEVAYLVRKGVPYDVAMGLSDVDRKQHVRMLKRASPLRRFGKAVLVFYLLLFCLAAYVALVPGAMAPG